MLTKKQSMEYTVGQELVWTRDNRFAAPESVTVVELRSRGQAKLSNGWIVDEDGIADGTGRMPGGRVSCPNGDTPA